MDFAAVIQRLNSLGVDQVQPGLERMVAACVRLRHPERAFKSVHVAGTNGKGSTIAFLESILRDNGYSVGKYTSPHLHDIRERMTTHGQMISEAEFVRAYQEVSDTCADIGLSYFEILTMMAFVHFRAHPVDIVLLETGLGGRWDATNVAMPLVSLITTIDYDHQALLGNKLSQIAAEKCGILKKGVSAVIAPQASEAMDVIQATVAELGIHAQMVQPLSADILLGLTGDHQRQNAALAIAAARMLMEHGFPVRYYFEPLAHTTWPGRLEWVSQDPPILCDVAHNSGGMRVLVNYLNSPPAPLLVSVILGIMKDKDAACMVRELAKIAGTFYCVAPNTTRALPAEDLAQLVRAAGKKAIVTTIADMKRDWKGTGLLVVTGSFYTVGEFKKDIDISI